MTKCTWLGCTKPAVHIHEEASGLIWAELCEEHEAAVSHAAVGQETFAMYDAWLMAQGMPSSHHPVCESVASK